MEPNDSIPKIPSPARNALILKCGGILLLVLLLQIPLMLVDGLRSEREQRRNEAVGEIGRLWGGAQTLGGPILIVPFTYQVESNEERIVNGKRSLEHLVHTYHANAYLLPERLQVEAQLGTESRSRGIYAAVVYGAALEFSGSFGKLDKLALGRDVTAIHWNEARLILPVSDLRGVREAPAWECLGKSMDWQPGTRWTEAKSGLQCALSGLEEQTTEIPFRFKLRVNGCGQFSVLPVGKTSGVFIASSWPSPSFNGAFLPSERSVNEGGFKARWTLSHLGRNLPQQWNDRGGEESVRACDLQAGAVGVGLMASIDAYRTTERALKHGLLVLALVFTAFLVSDCRGASPTGLIHYGLVGAALCLFYLGLLALSEFFGYAGAYSVSAAASILLICGHLRVIAGSLRAALLAGAGLSLVYAYLYFVLQMQDYALLAGTVALFAALGALMSTVRRLRVR